MTFNRQHAGLFLRVFVLVAAGAGPGACSTTPAPAPTTGPTPGTLAYDQNIFHSLLENHQRVRRSVTELPDGVRTLTESDDPEIAARITDHVGAMASRLHEGRRIRQWDPLFVGVFNHASKVKIEVTKTPRGVEVTETSDDAHVAAIIKAHAKTVSAFVTSGFDEASRSHPVPGGE